MDDLVRSLILSESLEALLAERDEAVFSLYGTIHDMVTLASTNAV